MTMDFIKFFIAWLAGVVVLAVLILIDLGNEE